MPQVLSEHLQFFNNFNTLPCSNEELCGNELLQHVMIRVGDNQVCVE